MAPLALYQDKSDDCNTESHCVGIDQIIDDPIFMYFRTKQSHLIAESMLWYFCIKIVCIYMISMSWHTLVLLSSLSVYTVVIMEPYFNSKI